MMSDINPFGRQRQVGSWIGSALFNAGVPIAIAGGLLLVALLLPSVTRSGYSRDASRRSQCRNHLKQIGLAFHEYSQVYGALPPAYTVDSEGRPLHSWRTLLLPFLDHLELYRAIDLSKPWDDPANRLAYESEVPEFCCPSAFAPEHFTGYLAVVDEETCLQPEVPRLLSEIEDGTRFTMLIMEVDRNHSVHWMSPTVLGRAECLRNMETALNSHRGATHVLLADGSVQMLTLSTPMETLRALTTIAGREAIGDDW